MSWLIFATNNQEKVEATNKYFEGKLEFQAYDYNFTESRYESIEAFAIAKAREAYENTKMPSVALSVGFYVEALNGFPGANLRHFLDTIGVNGLIKLLQGEEKRECCFRECLAYYDGNGQPKLFYGEYKGRVAREFKKEALNCDWRGLTYIFIPERKKVVWADMSDDEREMFKKDHEDTTAIKHFKEWYIDYLASEKYYKLKTLESNWVKTCRYIRDERKMPYIPFVTWIRPMRLVDCDGECLVFEFKDEILEDILCDIVQHIRKRYQKIILEAYNHCIGSKCFMIEIKYQ